MDVVVGWRGREMVEEKAQRECKERADGEEMEEWKKRFVTVICDDAGPADDV